MQAAIFMKLYGQMTTMDGSPHGVFLHPGPGVTGLVFTESICMLMQADINSMLRDTATIAITMASSIIVNPLMLHPLVWQKVQSYTLIESL